MENINRNKPGVKSTELKYLYDIAAIPKKTRDEYLQMLLKRKGAVRQKNVRLLKIIYEHITEGIMIQWDSTVICNELDISWEMLWCHKSRLLKGLREYYFNWKAIEKERFSGKNTKNLTVSLEKAELMERIGMRREAKVLFSKIKEILDGKKKRNCSEHLILFKALMKLSSYYFNFQNLQQYNFYIERIEKLGKVIIRKRKDLKPYIMSNLYTNMAYKIHFFDNKSATAFDASKYLQLALAEAKKANEFEQEALILENLAIIFKTESRDECLKYINIGMEIGKKYNLEEIYFSFNLFKDYINFYNGRIKKNEATKIFTDTVKKLNQLNISIKWKTIILFRLIGFASFLGLNEMLNKLLYEYNAMQIIHTGLKSYNVFRSLYLMKWIKYLREIVEVEPEIDLETKKQYLTVKRISMRFMNKLEQSIMEVSLSKKNLRQMVFRKEFFLIMILSDFWKGNKCSYNYAKHIIKQVDYINKLRPELVKSNKELIENSYMGINLMSDSQNLPKETFLKRYEMKFKHFADFIIESKTSFDLELYYMLSFIAEQCGYEELKEIVKDTFIKLQKKYPKEIANEIKKVEKGENETGQKENELMGVRAA